MLKMGGGFETICPSSFTGGGHVKFQTSPTFAALAQPTANAIRRDVTRTTHPVPTESLQNNVTPKPSVIYKILTFRAVISLPAWQADTIAGGGALVVAEVVVARPAQVSTANTVVMCVARDPIFVPHHGVRRPVFVLRPVLPHVQPPLRRQPRDQRLPCNNRHHQHSVQTTL